MGAKIQKSLESHVAVSVQLLLTRQHVTVTAALFRAHNPPTASCVRTWLLELFYHDETIGLRNLCPILWSAGVPRRLRSLGACSGRVGRSGAGLKMRFPTKLVLIAPVWATSSESHCAQSVAHRRGLWCPRFSTNRVLQSLTDTCMERASIESSNPILQSG
jgi:hypothetical protein